MRLFAGTKSFCLRFARWPAAGERRRCFDPERPFNEVAGGSVGTQGKRTARKVSCDECYFRCNLLCALELSEPCATFRPNDAQLRPPQQLRFVFRQERRSRAAWAFPSAQEQAALHA
jgi:hypothetical protein